MDKSISGSLVIKCSFSGTNHRINFVVIHCDWAKSVYEQSSNEIRVKQRANARNNSQHCWPNNFDRFQTLGSNSQKHATTCVNIQQGVQGTQHMHVTTKYNVGICWPTIASVYSKGVYHRPIHANLCISFYHKC